MKFAKYLLILLILPTCALAAAVPDTTNKVSTFNTSTTNPQTLSHVIGAGDNMDTIEIQSYAGAEASAVTCGSNTYTMLTDQNYQNYWRSIWYVLSPTTGTCTISITNSVFLGANFIAAVSFSGANTALGAGVFGTPVWVHDSYGGVRTAGSWSATATGGGANDVYLGMAFAADNGGTGTISDNSGNMVNLGAQGDAGSNNFSFDYVLGSHAGLMSYVTASGSSNVNVAFSVAIFGSSGGAAPSKMFLSQ